MEKEYKYKKYIIMIFFIVIIVVFFIWKLLIWNEIHIERYVIDSSKIVKNEYSFNIDNIAITSDYIDISGWIIKKEENIGVVEQYVILREKDNKKAFRVPTEMVKRDDLNTAFNSKGKQEYDYSYGGFHSYISGNYLDINKNYDIFILKIEDDKEYVIPLNNSIKGWDKNEKKN